MLSLGMLTSTLSTLLERNMVAVLVAYQMVTLLMQHWNNCLLVILVGATRWQKEHVEAAALRSLSILAFETGSHSSIG